MSRINGLSNNAIHKVVNSLNTRPAAAESAQTSSTPTDRVDLSAASHYMAVLKQQTGVRADLVASVRQQIDSGTYETDEKLNVAIDRMMSDLNG